MTEPTQEFNTRDVYFVNEMMSNFEADSKIVESLIQRGYSEEDAEALIQYVRNKPADTQAPTASAQNKPSPSSYAPAKPVNAKPEDVLLVKDMLSSMAADYDIRSALTKRGYSVSDANQLIREVRNERKPKFSYGDKKKRGQQAYSNANYQQYRQNSGGGGGQVALGLLIAGIGCAITFFTYSAASSSPTGGTYFIAYGPIIWGGIMVFKGLMNSD